MNIVRRLVLSVALMQFAPAPAQAQRQATASPALQKDFAAFMATFRAALKANDAAAVTGMTKLPFGSDYPDATKFLTKGYPKIFTPKTRACIQRTTGVYDRDGLGNDNYVVFCGDSGFVFTKTQAGFLFTDVSAND